MGDRVVSRTILEIQRELFIKRTSEYESLGVIILLRIRYPSLWVGLFT